MAKEEVSEGSPQDGEPGTDEPTDEELWDETPEEGSEEDTPEETVEEEAEEEESEEEDSEEEDPSHDYEKRYKDLEKEFHKRNEESARTREELQEYRLRTLEMQKQMQDFQSQTQKEDEAKKGPPPPGSDEFFNEDDRQTMDEFSELTKTFTKVVQNEIAKAIPNTQDPVLGQRLETLEQNTQERQYQEFLSHHQSYMMDNVGGNYRDLDKDPDFQSFVLASPALTKMMTESVAPEDHASVMQIYMGTESGAKWKASEEAETEEQAKPSERKQARRRAASGLMKNSAPRIEKDPDSMSAEELWDSIPETDE